MRFNNKVHTTFNQNTNLLVAGNSTTKSFLSSSVFKVLLIVGVSISLAVVIAVPIVIILGRENKSSSSLTISNRPSKMTTVLLSSILTSVPSNSISTTTKIMTPKLSTTSTTTLPNEQSTQSSSVSRYDSTRTSTTVFPTTSTTIPTTTISPTISLISTEETSIAADTTENNMIEQVSTNSDFNNSITDTQNSTVFSDFNATNVTMINTIEEFSTDNINNTFTLMESTETINLETSSIETISSTTITRSTTTTRRIPVNLLINPGAETGNILGWSQTGSSPAIIDSNGNFNSGYFPHSGTYCFAGGPGPNSPSGLIQNVNLLSGLQNFTAEQLDSGLLRVELQFFYQTWDHPLMKNDDIEVKLTFRSWSGSIIHTESTGEIACKRGKGWCPWSRIYPLPRNTRSIDYIMMFIRKDFGGSAIDSYIDDNSLKLI